MSEHSSNDSSKTTTNSSNDPLIDESQTSDSASFEFAMGDHTAHFPTDRYYGSNHMWVRETDQHRFQIGLTQYAVRLLQDVYFLDWILDPGANVNFRDPMGSIESKKAESDLFSPVTGKLIAINQHVLDDPSLINADAYGEGWMLEMEAASTDELLSPSAYAAHLVDAWEVAQRTIKGQANL